MASHERVRRVSGQIKRELSEIIPHVIFHPKVSLMSITGIDLSRDFKFATVFFTFIGTDEDRQEIDALLKKSAKEVRFHLAKRLKTRTVPELKFSYDTSVEYGAKMETLLRDLTKDIDLDKESDPESEN